MKSRGCGQSRQWVNDRASWDPCSCGSGEALRGIARCGNHRCALPSCNPKPTGASFGCVQEPAASRGRPVLPPGEDGVPLQKSGMIHETAGRAAPFGHDVPGIPQDGIPHEFPRRPQGLLHFLGRCSTRHGLGNSSDRSGLR
jgi:hypothetical protein